MSFKSEMDAKELELDESRSTLQKRIKNLENQLDDEATERKKIVDQRKETEAKLQVSKHFQFLVVFLDNSYQRGLFSKFFLDS